MGARSIPVVALLALLLVPVVVAEAKPKKSVCEWYGEKDPFTGEDTGRITLGFAYPFIQQYAFGKAREDGSAIVEVTIFWDVDTTERWREPVRFLLADGETIVDLVPTEPIEGQRVPWPDGTTATRFEIRGVWTRDDLGKIAHSEGVARVRFTGPGQGPVDGVFKKQETMKIVEVARCYFERREEER